MKKFLIMLILIAGCFADPDSAATSNPPIAVTDPHPSERSEEMSANSDDSIIATIKNRVFDAAAELRENWRMSREDFLSQPLDVIMVEEEYAAAWASDAVGPSILFILQREQDDWKVNDYDFIGRDVLHASVNTAVWPSDAPLLIVESYYPAGTGHAFTKASFYRIDPVQTKKVLEFENAGMFVQTAESDQMTIESFSLAYTVPSPQMNVEETAAPVISVYGKKTQILMKGEEVISKTLDTIESAYIWNHETLIFEER